MKGFLPITTETGVVEINPLHITSVHPPESKRGGAIVHLLDGEVFDTRRSKEELEHDIEEAMASPPPKVRRSKA